jgi:hypothetical protein
MGRLFPSPAAAGLLLLALLTACAPFRGYPERATPASRDLELLAPAIDADRILACLRVADATGARECRNQLITARVYATDLRFAAFEEDLFRQTRELGFAATIATLGLTGAGAVAGGGAAQILSAAAAGVTGSRAAVEKEVLGERTLTAIHTAMRANRTTVLARIRVGLQQGIAEYPLGAALTDVEDYYFAGTVLGALIGITEAVGVQAAEANRRLSVATGLSQSAAARALRLFFNEPGLAEDERVRRLRRIQAAAREEGLGDVNVASFVRDASPENEERLARVARRLQLLP